MKMKKLLSSLLALALVSTTVLTGCGTKTDEDPKVSSEDNGTPGIEADVTSQKASVDRFADIEGDLLVWLDNDDWAEAAIAKFNELYPNVNVTFENIGSTDQRSKLSMDGPSGTGADVVITPHDGIANMITDGLVEPIPEDLKAKYEKMIIPSALQTAVKDDELYSVPFQTENIAFLYNKDLAPEPPATFEELIEFAKEYNNPAESKYALRWQVDDSYHNYFFLSAFGMSVFGPDMTDYTNPGFDSAEATKGMEFHSSLREIFDVPTVDATYDFTVGAFQRGEVPFTISGPWAIADAKKNDVNFGVTKIPTIDGNQPITFSGAVLASVSSYTENPDAALAFVDFLASEEGASVLYDVKGTITAIENIDSIPGVKDDPYVPGFKEQAAFAKPMPVIPETASMWDPLKALFTFPWDAQLTVPEAQKKAMEDYELLLNAAGKSIKD